MLNFSENFGIKQSFNDNRINLCNIHLDLEFDKLTFFLIQ